MSLRRRLRSILWRVPVEQEVREELAHHRDLRTRELIDLGWDPAQAREEAERRVAGMETTLTKLGVDRNRHFARQELLGELGQDVHFAFRQCRRHPGFTLAAVLTLALGIGATTAIFSVVHAVVLRPFAYVDPDRVLLVFTTFRGNLNAYSVGNFVYTRQRVTAFDHFAAMQFSSFNLGGEGEPERVAGGRVTWDYFPVFGLPPAHGRTFTKEEDQPGRANVAVLSDRLWRRKFGGDSAIVGHTIRMNAETYDVIGIMPPEFEQNGDAAEVWVPVAFTADQLAMYDDSYLNVYARMKADISLAQAEDDLSRTAALLSRDHADMNTGRGAGAMRLGDFLVVNYRLRLLVLLAAVALVLLIACANVANLLLARLATRGRELAIRAAIGAGRGRIVRQVLTESLVLAAIGGTTGVVAARWALPSLVAMAPDGVPRLQTANLSGPVLAAAAGLVLLSTIIVGLLPAWQATRRTALTAELGDGKGTAGGSMKPWMRQTLIGAQAALVMVVLTGAALLVRSAVNLQQVPIGFDTTGVLTARVALPAMQYATPERARETFARLLERVQASPGVQFAALDPQAPLVVNGGSNGLVPEGQPFTGDRINSQSHFVTPDYFSVLRIPLKAGRVFTDADVRQSPLVMIVNETLAKAAYGDSDPIGKRMVCCEGSPTDPMYKTVVGVVADVKSRGPAQPARPEFYLPLAQVPDVAWTWIGRTLNVITRGDDTASMATAIRGAVRGVDSGLPVFAIRTMDEGLQRTMAQSRFNTMLMSLLAATGLVLAALGIYSVIAWLVAQRSREIGVRMALGASAADVVRLMVAHGLKPVLAGLAAGLAGALAATRLLQNQLFEVGPRDPATLLATAALLFAVAAAAAFIPAWRATGIDPSRALHDA
jgi:predicted permease